MLKKKYEYYVKANNRSNSKLILMIDSDIVDYLKNKLSVDGNVRDEVFNVLRNEQETQLFKLALWVNNDYYNTVHPNGFCLLFSSLACKQKLYVSVSKKGVGMKTSFLMIFVRKTLQLLSLEKNCSVY